MQVKEVMTRDPICCTSDSSLQEVARQMVEHDCGAIPVVDNEQNKKPIGMITDRDITCRSVAVGKNPLEMTAADCMTSSAMTVSPEDDIHDCCQRMEEKQVRRALVVDEDGCCCGIVAQADIARQGSEHDTAEIVREVSQPVGA